MVIPFNGFSEGTFSFLRDLKNNNSKQWFDANRERYNAHWLKPALDFVSAIESAADALSPPHIAQPRLNGSIRRIFRDTRFSKDKTPYNPRLHLVFWTGDHPNRSPAIHLVLSAENFGFGAGQWALSTEQVTRMRHAMCNEPSRDMLLNTLGNLKKTGCELDEPGLKRTPPGFEIDEQYSHLIRRKSLVARTLQEQPVPPSITNSDCVDYASDLMKKLAPINAWLIENT